MDAVLARSQRPHVRLCLRFNASGAGMADLADGLDCHRRTTTPYVARLHERPRRRFQRKRLACAFQKRRRYALAIWSGDMDTRQPDEGRCREKLG